MTPDALKKHYRVWTRQVNEDYFDVIAEDVEQAREKAVRIWRKTYGYPDVSEVLEMTEASHE